MEGSRPSWATAADPAATDPGATHGCHHHPQARIPRRRRRCTRRVDKDRPALHRRRPPRGRPARPQDPACQGRLDRAAHRRQACRQLAPGGRLSAPSRRAAATPVGRESAGVPPRPRRHQARGRHTPRKTRQEGSERPVRYSSNVPRRRPEALDGALTCSYMVGDTGFEPVTSSVSRKRATTALIALGVLRDQGSRGGDGI